MRVSPLQISADAQAYELQRTADFFRLLYIAEKRQLVAPHAISSVDWVLASSCLDEVNYRYADMAFLATLAACALLAPPPPPLRTSLSPSAAAITAATTTTASSTGATRVQRSGRAAVLSRVRLPRARHLYAALFAYNAALTVSAPCPATTYWNAVCMLATEMGNIARMLHAPTELCIAVPTRGLYAPPALPAHAASPSLRSSSSAAVDDGNNTTRSATPWTRHARTLVELVMLRQLLAHTFDGTCWRHRTTSSSSNNSSALSSTATSDADADVLTALVISNRFMRWNVFSLRATRPQPGVVVYNAHVNLPRLRVSRSLRRSYACRGIILERSPLGARWWYTTHFAVMRMLGLHTT